ncbi:MAG: hypothetical protein FJ284_16095, partial [Planctomycetes bacterium]|nr:hypothetical protein [Planctomycetota bacterium]
MPHSDRAQSELIIGRWRRIACVAAGILIGLPAASLGQQPPARTLSVKLGWMGGRTQYNTTTTLPSSFLDPQDTAGLVAATNWNNFNQQNLATATALVDGTGISTEATLRYVSGGAFSGRQAWGGSPENARLMGSGLRSIMQGSSAYNPFTGSQFLFENLQQIFPLGYDVYVYVTDDDYQFMNGAGTVYLNQGSTAYKGTTNGANINAPANPADWAQIYPGINMPFSGTWEEGTNYVKFPGRSEDKITITGLATSGPQGNTSGAWYTLLWTGIQLVGELPPAGQYWHGDGVNQGGSGTWTDGSNTWGSGGVVGPMQQGLMGIFPLPNGEVTIGQSGATASGGLTFTAATEYELIGGPLTLAGAGAAANAVIVQSAATATISARVVATAGLTKSGLG